MTRFAGANETAGETRIERDSVVPATTVPAQSRTESVIGRRELEGFVEGRWRRRDVCWTQYACAQSVTTIRGKLQRCSPGDTQLGLQLSVFDRGSAVRHEEGIAYRPALRSPLAGPCSDPADGGPSAPIHATTFTAGSSG
jgi:hypothetical protein